MARRATIGLLLIVALAIGQFHPVAAQPPAEAGPFALKGCTPAVLRTWQNAGVVVSWTRCDMDSLPTCRPGMLTMPGFAMFDLGSKLPRLPKDLPMPDADFGIRAESYRLTAENIDDIARMENVTALYLFGANIGDDDLKKLASLKKLRTLDLHATDITDAGLKGLAKFPSLEVLRLGGSWHTYSAPGTARGCSVGNRAGPEGDRGPAASSRTPFAGDGASARRAPRTGSLSDVARVEYRSLQDFAIGIHWPRCLLPSADVAH